MEVIKMPNTMPLISVVVPTYNRAHVVSDSIHSILEQTYQNLEVIVVDDGSTDETERVLTPLREKISYVRTENKGLAAARNTGMRRASGEYIAWLDSDDMWLPDKLMIQAAYMISNPDVVLTSTDFTAFNEQGIIERSHIRSYYGVIDKTPNGFSGIYSNRDVVDISPLLKSVDSDDAVISMYHGHIHDFLVGGSCIHPPTVLIRKSATQKIGDVDESEPNGMDYDYFIRLSRLGKVAYIDMPLLRYRYTDDQMSSDRHLINIKLSVLRAIQKIQKDDPLYAERNSRFYKHRLAQCHAGVAAAAVETNTSLAFTHLIRSISLGHLDKQTPKVLAKAILPSWLLQQYRRHNVSHRDKP